MSLLPRGRECNAKKWELMARQPPWRGGRPQRARQTHEREGAWKVRCRPTSIGRLRLGLGQERASLCRGCWRCSVHRYLDTQTRLTVLGGGMGSLRTSVVRREGNMCQECTSTERGKCGYKRGERAAAGRCTSPPGGPSRFPALSCRLCRPWHVIDALVVRSSAHPPGLSIACCLSVVSTIQGNRPRGGRWRPIAL